ncbi:MAG: glycosyltransferase [Planctomycetes bacterium]|nr:glycosyltransferase [Planctomycetota bacterium]
MSGDRNMQLFDSRYDAACYRPKPGYFAALHTTRLALLRQLPAAAHVLDVGCGSGTYLLPLCADGRRVTGLDCSPTILAELRAAAPRHGVDPAGVDARPGDVCDMPFADASFDVVFSFATLYAVPRLEPALAEIARVLRPGGVALLELGNARSLNHIEAKRVDTGIESRHLPPGRMRRLLRDAGLAWQWTRAFQLFPMWNGGTPRARDVLHPQLDAALAANVDGALLDERISSSPWLMPFAFRHLVGVVKGGVEAAPEPVPPLPAEAAAHRERRRRAAQHLADGEAGAALQLLLDNLREAPDDPRSALDLAGLYDGADERRLVRRWHRLLTRCRRWPAEGATRTAAPATPPTAPKVSIVLPSFDAGHLLPEAVQSVFAQTFGDFELIVVDDGSRDDTWRYLARLSDPRLQVLRHANQRLPTALNRGFALARGELRTWISADNVCEPHMLERLVTTLDAEPDAVLAVAGFARVDQRLDVLSTITGQDVSFAGFLPRNPGVAAFAYRATTAALVGDYEPTLEGAEDWDYWLRLVEHGRATLLPDVLYRYREHARSMTTTIPDKVRTASERTVQRWLQRHGGLPALDRLGGDPAIWFRLGTRLLQSPFVPLTAAVAALRESLRTAPHDGRALVQLAIALARSGAHAPAAELARRFAHVDRGLAWLATRITRLAAGDRSLDPLSIELLPCDGDGSTVAAS